MVTQNYTISTVKVATPPKVKMSQYDYGMRTITFAVVDGSGAAVDLTGKTVTVEGTRIDGHAFATTCTVADNEATFVDTVDMTNAAGDHPAELVVRQNDERLGTMNFIISVEPAAMDEGADVSPEDKNLFEQLYAKVVSGSPVAVDTVAEMTNTDGVYLYTGNESGYTKGYWYYYDGSAWVAGGAYGSGATDKTLTLSDVAADAKVVGDYLDEISEGILESYVTEGTYTSAGVTFTKVSETKVAMYGTSTANRRYNVFNGFLTVRTTSSPFQKMLSAGKYRFIVESENLSSDQVRLSITYTTYADTIANVYVNTSKVLDLTSDFMFGINVPNATNCGTAESPAIITVKVESITAKDEVARSKVDSVAIHETVSGSVVAFPDGSDGYPIKSLSVSIVPSQSGSGDPSPSNVRPITGWSAVKVTRTGKNVLNSDSLIKTTNSVFVKNSDGSYAFTHYGTGYANRSSSQAPVRLSSGQTVSVSFKYSGTITSAISIRFLASDGAYTDYSNLTLSGGTASCTLTLTKDEVGAEFYFGSGGVGEVLTITDIQIEVGSTTDYEPYTAKEYTISIGDTVYGGTLDVVNGKVVVDRKAVDLGDLSWTMSSTRFYSNLTDAIATKVGGDTNALCSSYRRVPYNNSTFATGDFCVCDSNFSGTKRCLFQNANIASADDFKTSVTGQTLVYTLATPIEITLTPTQITTLLGGNTIWADAGDVSVEYVADTKLFIFKVIGS